MNTSTVELLLGHPQIKGTIYEKMLRRGVAMQDPKIQWDSIQTNDFSNPFAKTYQDLNDEIQRIYGEQMDSTKKSADITAMGDTASYQDTIDALNSGLKEDMSNLVDREANAGTWGTSAREERQNSLANKYTQKYNSAYNIATRNAGLESVKNQQQLGYNFYSPTFNKYQAGTNGLSSQVGQTYKYDPFKQAVGGIEASKNYTLRQL